MRPLTYESNGRAPRITARRAALLFCVVFAAGSAWEWRGVIRRRGAVWYWQRECGRYSANAGQPIIQVGASATATLPVGGADWHSFTPAGWAAGTAGAPPAVVHQPRCWLELLRAYQAAGGAPQDWADLHLAPARVPDWLASHTEYTTPPRFAFLGERRTKRGERRLVIVTSGEGKLQATILTPATLTRGAAEVRGENYGDFMTRAWRNFLPFHGSGVCVGSPDPADPAHFTIPYVTARGRGTIDAWLVSGGTVLFHVRDGPAYAPNP